MLIFFLQRVLFFAVFFIFFCCSLRRAMNLRQITMIRQIFKSEWENNEVYRKPKICVEINKTSHTIGYFSEYFFYFVVIRFFYLSCKKKCLDFLRLPWIFYIFFLVIFDYWSHHVIILGCLLNQPKYIYAFNVHAYERRTLLAEQFITCFLFLFLVNK